MPVRLDVQLSTVGLRLTQERAREAVRRLQGSLQQDVLQAAQRGAVVRLRRTLVPRPNNQSDYPLTWRSERQRRYVMAKLRRENNLPYRRTGRMVGGWSARVRFTPRGGQLEVVNPSAVLDFVAGTGPARQPMFPRWYNYNEVLARAANEELAPLVARAWSEVWR